MLMLRTREIVLLYILVYCFVESRRRGRGKGTRLTREKVPKLYEGVSMQTLPIMNGVYGGVVSLMQSQRNKPTRARDIQSRSPTFIRRIGPQGVGE